MGETARERGQRLARESLASGDVTGWFEILYAGAQGDAQAVQWTDMEVNPHLAAWLERAGTGCARCASRTASRATGRPRADSA